MKVRLTQKDLKFGIYWGPKNSLNPGLSIWLAGRYIWPWKRGHGKRAAKNPELPFDPAPHMSIKLDESRPTGTLRTAGGLESASQTK
jgi:hypothetical protein